MSTWHFYDPATGLFAGVAFEGDSLGDNTPAGCAAWAGECDPLSQRVDMACDPPALVDWQPPRPSEDHDWDADARRWRLRADVAQWASARDGALFAIGAIEARQHRAVREVATAVHNVVAAVVASIPGLPGDVLDALNACATAAAKLGDIEAEIEPQRAIVRAPKPEPPAPPEPGPPADPPPEPEAPPPDTPE